MNGRSLERVTARETGVPRYGSALTMMVNLQVSYCDGLEVVSEVSSSVDAIGARDRQVSQCQGFGSTMPMLVLLCQAGSCLSRVSLASCDVRRVRI